MPDPTQIHLSQLMTKIEFFNQRQLATSMGAVTDGYCHAMCLDWIRRALQHLNRAKSLVFRFEEASGSERTTRIVGRQMAMQAQISAKKTAVQSKQNDMWQTSNVLDQGALDAGNMALYLTQTLQQNPQFDAFSKSDLFPVGHRRNALNTIGAGLFEALPDEMSRAQWTSFTSNLNAKKTAREDERDDLRGAAPNLSSYATLYRVSMPTLKSTLENHRRLGQDGPPSRRGFDGIVIHHTRNAVDFPEPQAHSVLDIVCEHLNTNQAAMIGFDIGSSGHEVAIRVGSDTQDFLFLDPNYGIFRGRRADLDAAFDFLFDRQQGIYNNTEAPDGGAIMGTFDFTVFKRTDG